MRQSYLKNNVFKGSTNINDPSACAILASKRLLDRLIQFAEKVKKCKNTILTSFWNGKTWHKQVSNFIVLTFFIIKNLLLYIRTRKFQFLM